MRYFKLFLVLAYSVLLVSCASCPLPDKMLKNISDNEREKAELINFSQKLRCFLEKDSSWLSKKNTIGVEPISDDTGKRLPFVTDSLKSSLAKGLGENFTVSSALEEEVRKRMNYLVQGTVYLKKNNLLHLTVKDMKTKLEVFHGEFNLSSSSTSIINRYDKNPLISPVGSKPYEERKQAVQAKELPKGYLEKLAVQEMVEKGEKYLDEKKYEQAIQTYEKIPGVTKPEPDPALEIVYERLYQANYSLYLLEKVESRLETAKKWLIKQVFAHLNYTKDKMDAVIKFKVDSSNFRDEEKVEYLSLITAIDTFFGDPEHRSCVSIFGHASRTGNVGHNCQLSRDRANRVGKIMNKTFSKKKLVAVGRSCLDSKTGKTVDDDTTAIDRRVEFKIINCDQKNQNRFPSCESYVQKQGYNLETDCPQLPVKRPY